MSRLAVDIRLGSQSTYNFPADTYDSTKLGLGTVIKQLTGSNPEDKFVTPIPVAIARPVETVGAIPGIFPWCMQWSSTLDWVFLADNATAAATRRIQLFTFNRSTGVFSWFGSVTLSFPFAGTQNVYIVRCFRMTYDKYVTGTVSVTGTAVTGSSTAWSTSGIPVGCRIGFGFTDPTLITQWYEISAVGSDTSITLTSTAGSIGSGSAYVIEDLRAVTVMTNALTATNGGVFVTKGLRVELFTPGTTAIPAATTVDNIRANYWLKDAANTNTVSFGAGILDRTDWTTHYLFILDTLANAFIYKYNIRAPLTLVSGASTGAAVLKSGAGGILSGAPTQNNNGRIATAGHGPGIGIPCLYFTTATKVYRTIDVTTILAGSTVWLSDSMLELPPGAGTTFTASSSLNSIEYAEVLDRFIIPTALRAYVTQYKTDVTQWDRIMFSDNKQTFQTTADSTLTPFPEAILAIFTVWSNQGILYLAGIGTTAITNFLYAVPIGADWEYAATSNQRCILPAADTSTANNLVRACMNVLQINGGRNGKNLGMPSEPVRMYYRTTGITDNSGSWTLLDYTGDLSSVSPGTSIQFMLEWRVIGPICIPAKVFSVTLIYDDLSTDSHYQPSVGNSSTTNKQFAWRFATAFGSTVPRLKIRLYDAVSGGLLVTDDSVTLAGTWAKSTDGGATWSGYDTSDKINNTTYIRFTPLSLGDNIRVRALLTLY